MSNDSTKQNNSNTKWVKILLIGTVILVVGLLALSNWITEINQPKPQGNIKTPSDITNDLQSQESNSKQDKEYYNFLDKEYGTFNFTEEEYVKRVMIVTGGNSSYQAQGYERMKATIPNQYNYASIINGNVNNLSIVSNPENGKVSCVKMGVIGKFTKEEAEQNIISILSNLTAGIVDLKDINDKEKMQESNNLIQEIIDEVAPNKGLHTVVELEPQGSNYSCWVTVEVSL